MSNAAYPLLICCLAIHPLAGQSAFQLAPTESHRLTNPATVVLPLKCGRDGNVFMRTTPNGPGIFEILKVSPDGSTKANYRYASVPELKSAFIDDFSVGDHGELYEIGEMGRDQTYIFEFTPEGEFKGKVELEVKQRFNPSQLVALPGPTFFVSGTLVGDAQGHNAGGPFNAIFDANGKLVRTVSLKKDANPKSPPQTADRTGSANLAVRFGSALLGDDGDLYLMRAAAPAIVHVLSPTGDILRTIKVLSPTPQSEPTALLVGGGRLVVQFSIPNASDVSGTRLRVADARNGHTIMDFKITPQLSEAVACYSPAEFTFIGTDRDLWPTIVRAATH